VNGNGIGIGPERIFLKFAPGEASEGKVTVYNSTTAEMNVRLYATPFSIRNNDYTNIDVETPNAHSLIADWIHFTTPTITVRPGASLTVGFSANVPANVPAGGQYAAIFAEEVPDVDASATAIAAISRVGALVYARPSAGATETAEVTDQGVSAGLYFGDAALASYKIKNTGNTDVAVASRLVVRGMFDGRTVADEAGSTHYVLSASEYSGDDSWATDGRVGFYKTEYTVSYLGRTATIERPLVLFPAWSVVAVGVGFVIVASAVVFGIIKHRRAAKSRENDPNEAGFRAVFSTYFDRVRTRFNRRNN
jgi:hypothetical protein